VAPKIVIEITPKETLSKKQLLKVAKDVKSAITSETFEQFLDFGDSSGESIVKVYVVIA